MSDLKESFERKKSIIIEEAKSDQSHEMDKDKSVESINVADQAENKHEQEHLDTPDWPGNEPKEKGKIISFSGLQPQGIRQMEIVDLKKQQQRARGKSFNDNDNKPFPYPDEVSVENPSSFCSFYGLTRALMKFSMHQFFREIVVLGKHNIPKTGPVIFCGNHQNQFMDGSILFSHAQRDVRFMVAAKSMRRPVLKQLFEGGKSIPVERAQDHAKPGVGTIAFISDTVIKGIKSEFLKQFKVGDSIKIISKGDQVEIEDQIIESVYNDTELILKKPGAIIRQEQEYSYKVLPKFDQSIVFKEVEKVLGAGGCVAMFPEGGSHDNSDLLPFKAGIAMMTFGTIERTGQVPVIIPSGLKYFKRHEFRSRCIIEFGRGYRPTNKMVNLYKGGEKRKAISLFLKDIEERMREVTMTAPSINELQAIYMARNLYLPEGATLTEEQENDLYQKFSKGYNQMKEQPELQHLVEAITSYRQKLKLLNTTDDQIHLFKTSWFKQILLLLISLIRLILSLIFVLPGNIMIFPLSSAVSFYAETERIKALKASNVKVKANDVLASIKTLAYISTLPVYLLIFSTVFYRTLRSYFMLDRGLAWTYTTIFFVFFPIVQLISIRSHDGVKTHYSEFQGRLLSLFYTKQVALIQSVRQALKEKVEKAVDKVGPQVFENFEQLRIIAKDPVHANQQREEKQRMKKSASHNLLNAQGDKHDSGKKIKYDDEFAQLAASTRLSRKDQKSMFSSRKGSLELPKSLSDYDLDYIEELELNKAFNVFKDI